MNPNGNLNMELPPPVLPESSVDSGRSIEVDPGLLTHENSVSQPNGLNTASGQTVTPTALPMDNNQTNALNLPSQSLPTSTSTNTLLADDKDDIEKEWVNKVKSIVRTTREDPYKQNEELNLLKLDYLQKRYNKVLKTSI